LVGAGRRKPREQFRIFSIIRYSKKLYRTQRFRNWICFHEGETPTLLGPLETANLIHWRLALSNGSNRVVLSPSSPKPEMETYPVSEMLCFLVFFRIPDYG
jgi:hypothetical protein